MTCERWPTCPCAKRWRYWSDVLPDWGEPDGPVAPTPEALAFARVDLMQMLRCVARNGPLAFRWEATLQLMAPVFNQLPDEIIANDEIHNPRKAFYRRRHMT